MPKLDKKTAGTVEKEDAVHGGDFAPIKPGKYLARLSEVEVQDDLNKYDAAQWSAEFDNLRSLEDLDEPVPGRQWLRLTLPTSNTPHPAYEKGPTQWEKYQKMLRGRLKAFFEAFGYTSDSDTDEMIGEWAVITVAIETAQAGKREGQPVNVVKDITEVPEDIDIPEIDDDGDDKF